MLDAIGTANVWLTTLPGREAVTLRSRGPSAAAAEYEDYTVHDCQQKPSESGESPLAGVVAALPRKRWMMWQVNLDAAGAPAPKVGDLVVESTGREWVVQSARRRLFGNEHDLDCQERA